MGRPPAPAGEVERRVLEAASAQYLRLGFRSVTTDETARAAGVSKKTLYRHFPSKADLLRGVIRRNTAMHRDEIRGICGDPGAPVLGRLRRMMDYLSRAFRDLSPALVRDLRRGSPDVWNEVEKSRQRCLREDFGALLREGREQGVFRQDVDPKVFLAIYSETVRHVLNPASFASLDLPPALIQETVFKVLFEGVLTEKARKEPP